MSNPTTETKLVHDRKLATVGSFEIHSIRPITETAEPEPGFTIIRTPPSRAGAQLMFIGSPEPSTA